MQTCSFQYPIYHFCILSTYLQAELRWLDLSQCKLTNIQDELTRFPKLQMLYLHANQITKLSDVKKLGKLSGLQKLTLHGNPIAAQPHYKYALPSCVQCTFWARDVCKLAVCHDIVAVLDHWSYAVCVGQVTLMQQICMYNHMGLCRLQVLSCMPTLRELDFVAVSKLDRDTVSVWTKAQRGGRKA